VYLNTAGYRLGKYQTLYQVAADFHSLKETGLIVRNTKRGKVRHCEDRFQAVYVLSDNQKPSFKVIGVYKLPI